MLGCGISGEECEVLLRAGGQYLPARCLPLDEGLASHVGGMGLELLRVELPPDLEPGLLHIEVQKGACSKTSRPEGYTLYIRCSATAGVDLEVGIIPKGGVPGCVCRTR